VSVLDGIVGSQEVEADDGSALAAQRRRNAVAKAALAAEFGLLPATKVARWCAEGRLFTVHVDGAARIPGFQLDADGPRPVIAAALRAFAGKPSPWETALWFTGSVGWLGGAPPVDVLDSDPDAVVVGAGAWPPRSSRERGSRQPANGWRGQRRPGAAGGREPVRADDERHVAGGIPRRAARGGRNQHPRVGVAPEPGPGPVHRRPRRAAPAPGVPVHHGRCSAPPSSAH
jgi:hypothetical protein